MVKQVEQHQNPSLSRFPKIRRKSFHVPKSISNVLKRHEELQRKNNSPKFWDSTPGQVLKYFLNNDFGYYKTNFSYSSNDCHESIEFETELEGVYKTSFELYRAKPECNSRTSIKFPKDYEVECKHSPECEGSGKALYIWLQHNTSGYEDFWIVNDGRALVWGQGITQVKIESVEFPDNEYEVNSIGTVTDNKIYAKVFMSATAIQKTNANPDERYYITSGELVTYEWSVNVIERREFAYLNGYEILGGVAYVNYEDFLSDKFISFHRTRTYSKRNAKADYTANLSFLESGKNGYSLTPYREGVSTFTHEAFDGLGNKIGFFASNISGSIIVHNEDWLAVSYCEGGERLIQPCDAPFNPYPPPPPRKMKCCPDNSDLLAQIYKIVKENKKAIGVTDYPVTVPKSLIEKDGKDSGEEKIESLTSFLAWYVKRFDEIMGQWEIPIDIQDNDLLTQGNQSVKVKLPNIAETMAEMFTMLLNLNVVNEVQLNMGTRILAEAGADKQQNHKAYMAIESIIEFLGYKTKETPQVLDLTFSPGETDLSKILQEKSVLNWCLEYDDTSNLPKQMYELLQAAAIIRAVHWRRIDISKDPAKQIANLLLSNKELIEKLIGRVDIEKLEKEINQIQKEQNEQ